MGKRGPRPIGVTTTTVRTTTAAEEGYDPRPALDQAWSDVANMEPGQALAAAFKIRGISHVQLSKIVRGETRKIHRCTPGDPTPEEFENFVVARWRAGKYELAPVYKGFLLRRRSWVIGEDGDEGAGAASSEGGEDVDAVIAGHLKRKSAMVTLREIQAMEKGDAEGDDVKATELMTELLKLERERSARLEDRLERVMDRLNAPPPQTPPPTAGPSLSWEALVPVLLGAAAKLPAPLMNRVLARVMGVVAPAEKIPEGGWTPDSVMNLLSQAAPMFQQLGPILQGVLASFTGRPITVTQPDGTPITAIPANVEQPQPSNPPPGVHAMPITLSPEGKLALDIAVQHIRDEDYLSAWEALGTSQDTVPFLVGLNPLSKPVSYLPLWLGWLGQEEFVKLRGSVMAFIQWAQAHKAELIREEQEPEKDDDTEPPAA
jgi:hypothetical protein